MIRLMTITRIMIIRTIMTGHTHRLGEFIIKIVVNINLIKIVITCLLDLYAFRR